MRHSHHYGEGAKPAKLTVLKGFHLVVDVLLHDLGLIIVILHINEN